MNRITRLAVLLVAPALVAGTAAVPPGTADAAAHTASRGASDVTLTVDDHEPTVGDRITFKAHERPARAGTRLVLQVLYDNRRSWKTLDQATVGDNGRHRFVERIKTDRTRKYRVVRAAGTGPARLVSRPVKVVPYEWMSLTSLPSANDVSWSFNGSASVDGVAYPASLVSFPGATTGSVDINLAHACKAVDATYGLDDSSPTTGSATVSVAVGGTPVYAQSFTLTHGQHATLDVTDAFRVTFGFTSADGGRAVVGSPKALCHD